jgi:DNA-directed RNA polymerase specialized sigma24 family protein
LRASREVDNVLAAVSEAPAGRDEVAIAATTASAVEAANDGALVERALAGDAQAMSALVDRLLHTVQTRVGLVLLRRPVQTKGRSLRSETEDLTQEVFASLFDGRGKVLRDWRPERGLSLRGFVGLVAERQAAAILRTGKRSPFTEDPTSAETLGALGGAGEQRSATFERLESRDLLEALVDGLAERLSVQGFRLFELLYVEERSVEETCALAGLSADAVYAWRSRIGRLARELRQELLSERPPEGSSGRKESR